MPRAGGTVALFALLAPRAVLACPACAAASSERDGTLWLVLGLFLLVPFALSAALFPVLRTLSRAPGARP